MEDLIPSWFKMPQLDPYDGTSDLLDYLKRYKARIQIQGTTDTLFYITFLVIFGKASRASSSKLKPRSIDFFKQLERQFVAHFMLVKRYTGS